MYSREKHQGEQLQEAVKQYPSKVTGFSKAISKSRQQVYDYFKMKVLDPELRARSAEVLGVPVDTLFPEVDTAELTSGDRGATSAEPVMYQEVVRALIKAQDELIESAKAQRRMSDAQIEISKVLLEERQQMKEAATNAQEANKGMQKEMEKLRSNWALLERSVSGSHLKLQALEQLVVNRAADLPKKKPDEIVNLLRGITERIGQDKKLSSKQPSGN